MDFLNRFSSRGNNVFVSFLSSLGIKFTNSYSDKQFNEHPHKYNLYGLSRLLSDYCIENAAAKIEDKSDVNDIQTPFVAQVGGEFVVVEHVDDKIVSYIRNGQVLRVDKEDFIHSWTGIILLAEKTNESIETDYKEHKLREILSYSKQVIIMLFIVISFIYSYVNHDPRHSFSFTIALIINVLGIYVCYLLIKKQLDYKSSYIDKICSLFKQSDCNNVLESDATKFLNIFSWSEIGLGYFMVNTISLLFFPQQISNIAIINLCILPYSFWSVWYQKVKAKQWCPLCITVQVLLWILFIINVSSNAFDFHLFLQYGNLTNILFLSFAYLACVTAINVLVKQLGYGNKIEQVIQEINSLKSNELVLKTILEQQSYYNVDKNTSAVILGNPEAEILVTILTNPHCAPCADMHKRVEDVLKKTKNLCVQYIFSSFGPSYDISSKYTIALYLQKNIWEVREIYAEWYKSGKQDKTSFMKKYPVDIDSQQVKQEYLKHTEWRKETGLSATPTILINGYKLPDNFKIEDLIFLNKL